MIDDVTMQATLTSLVDSDQCILIFIVGKSSLQEIANFGDYPGDSRH